jgi:mono/diheme cytochrome c family protein
LLKLKSNFKFTRVLLVLGLSGIVAACAGVKLPVATERDATRARDRYPGVTAMELAHGRQLYQGRCGSCHRPLEPTAVPTARWPEHVRKMTPRARLSDDEAALVEKYVVTMSARN